jgi:hypothetical protein
MKASLRKILARDESRKYACGANVLQARGRTRVASRFAGLVRVGGGALLAEAEEGV